MNDFGSTIILIVLAGMLGAFIKSHSKDKCLKDFNQGMITLLQKNGKEIWGKLYLTPTGMELKYKGKHKDMDGHMESSYLFYKNEYPEIQAVVRFLDDLSGKNKRLRNKSLKKSYHPNVFRRTGRKLNNIFHSIRDALTEIMHLLVGQAKAAGMVGKKGGDKQAKKIGKNLLGASNTSFEPLLERYIGHRVVLQVQVGEVLLEYEGVLKEYTSEFVEIMDVNYKIKKSKKIRKADLVLPRSLAVVRHLAE